jgi:hypothetical protein
MLIIAEDTKMKITRKQLAKIIAEEKTKIATQKSFGSNAARQSKLLREDATGTALSDLYAAIDSMISAMGNEGALTELEGIVEDWDSNFGSEPERY